MAWNRFRLKTSAKRGTDPEFSSPFARIVHFYCCTAGVRCWHGPEASSGALYDCYRMSSGLKPDSAFELKLTRT
jgi:hypothetical protein